MADQKSSFGLGVLFGAVVGGLTAFFLSPKSGKENREDVAKKVQELKKLLEDSHLDERVKEVYGEVSKEAKMCYVQTKVLLIKKLAELKEKVHEIDKKKYMEIVDEVVLEFKKESKHTEKIVAKLREQLESDWKKITKK